MSKMDSSPSTPLSPILYTIHDEKARDQMEMDDQNPSLSVILPRSQTASHILEAEMENLVNKHFAIGEGSPILSHRQLPSNEVLSKNPSKECHSEICSKLPSNSDSQGVSEGCDKKEEGSAVSSQVSKRSRKPPKLFLNTYRTTSKTKWTDKPKPSDYERDRFLLRSSDEEDTVLRKRNKSKHDSRTSMLSKNFKADALLNTSHAAPLPLQQNTQPSVDAATHSETLKASLQPSKQQAANSQQPDLSSSSHPPKATQHLPTPKPQLVHHLTTNSSPSKQQAATSQHPRQPPNAHPPKATQHPPTPNPQLVHHLTTNSSLSKQQAATSQHPKQPSNAHPPKATQQSHYPNPYRKHYTSMKYPTQRVAASQNLKEHFNTHPPTATQESYHPNPPRKDTSHIASAPPAVLRPPMNPPLALQQNNPNAHTASFCQGPFLSAAEFDSLSQVDPPIAIPLPTASAKSDGDASKMLTGKALAETRVDKFAEDSQSSFTQPPHQYKSASSQQIASNPVDVPGGGKCIAKAGRPSAKSLKAKNSVQETIHSNHADTSSRPIALTVAPRAPHAPSSSCFTINTLLDSMWEPANTDDLGIIQSEPIGKDSASSRQHTSRTAKPPAPIYMVNSGLQHLWQKCGKDDLQMIGEDDATVQAQCMCDQIKLLLASYDV